MLSTKWFNGSENMKDAHLIRRMVFIEEQGVDVSEEMIQSEDEISVHLVVYEDNAPVATGRVIKADDKFFLGRIAVLKEHRGKRYGDLVVRMLIRKAFDKGGTMQYLHSQKHASGFYEKLGFVAYGDEFFEAGIPHVSMLHEGDVSGNCPN